MVVKGVGVYAFSDGTKTLNFDRVGFKDFNNLMSKEEAGWVLTMWAKKLK